MGGLKAAPAGEQCMVVTGWGRGRVAASEPSAWGRRLAVWLP